MVGPEATSEDVRVEKASARRAVDGGSSLVVRMVALSYLGAAIYDQAHTAIKLLRDVGEDHEFRLLAALLEQEEPTTVLSNKAQDVRLWLDLGGQDSPPEDVYVENSSDLEGTGVTQSSDSLADTGEISSKSDDLVVRSVTAESGNEEAKEVEEESEKSGERDEVSDDEDADLDPKPPTLIFLPNNAYNYESGFRRISELFAEECFTESENQLVTRFRIDITSRNMFMVRALDALLTVTWIPARIGVLNVRTPVTAIKTIVVAEMVEIDKATYHALDIFADSKKAEYILNRLRSGTAKVKHWENLYKMISKCCVHWQIYGKFDFRDSLVENRLVVNSGVDPELDKAKELYRRLPGILTQVAHDESKRLQADTCSVAYVPMIGYLLAVPYDFNVEQFDDLQVIYSTDNTLNVKSERMRELDEELGDVKMKIIDKETTIAIRMSSLILSRSALLLGVERVTIFVGCGDFACTDGKTIG
ncbi:MutS family domain IV, partial [Ostertagia ostertagi]